MTTKSKILIFSGLIVGIIIVNVLSVYINPILISFKNKGLNDGSSVFLAGVSARKQKGRQINTVPPQTVGSSFSESFSADYTLTEAGSMNESKNSNWWLNSGAYLYSNNGAGKTIYGSLTAMDPWRFAYNLSNPIDTDNGYHPQNIFRLVSKSRWQNLQQEAYFKIVNINLSSSPNRNASNGILLFNRYQDGNNLYYTGLRVDGYITIKKKINGEYYTMAYKRLFQGDAYNRDGNSNLLPTNVWVGVRSEVKNNTDGTVSVKVFVDNGKIGSWVLAADVVDDGKSFGGPAIMNSGYAGIRTDFMDVEFDDYKISEF